MHSRNFRVLAFIAAVFASFVSNQVQAQSSTRLVINCAIEGGVCNAPINTRIFFGLNGALLSATNATTIPCTTAGFGGDPLIGVPKSCWYEIDTSRVIWNYCATEAQNCNVQGMQIVRYGSPQSGKWVYKTMTGVVACKNETFGDPAFLGVKVCEIGTSF